VDKSHNFFDFLTRHRQLVERIADFVGSDVELASHVADRICFASDFDNPDRYHEFAIGFENFGTEVSEFVVYVERGLDHISANPAVEEL
jgi:hypothetical protein